MIVDENVTDYLRSLIREEDAFLELSLIHI